MAPVIPMLTEEIYQKFVIPALPDTTKPSVHLEQWPQVNEAHLDETVEAQMKGARQIIETVRALKAEGKIKLRWPTRGLLILNKSEDQSADPLVFQNLIQEMSNVKELTVVSDKPTDSNLKSAEVGDFTVFLDLTDSEDLQQERILSDLLRQIQALRKQAKLQIGDPIALTLATSHPFLKKALQVHKPAIMKKVFAEKFTLSTKALEADEESTFLNFSVCTNGTCFAMVRENAVKKVQAGKAQICGYCNQELSEDLIGTIHIKFQKL